jgi:O-antigen/teichoic acid export membrane protein
MMAKNNTSISKSIPYVIIKVFGFTVSIITLPILTNLFTKNQFGLISTIEAVMSLLISLFLFGIPQSYIRYYNKYKNRDYLLFNYNFLIMVSAIFVICLIFSSLILSFSIQINQGVIIILSFIVAFSVAMQQVSSIIRAKEKTLMHAMILGLNDILIYSLPIFIILIFGLSIENYFVSKLIVPFFLFILILFIVRSDITFSKFSSHLMKKMFYYGAPLIMVSMGATIFSTADRVIINYLIGIDSVAVYTVSSKISYAIQQLMIFPIMMVMFPMYIRIWETEGRQKTEEVLSRWLLLYCFIGIPIIAGSFLINKELILVLSNNAYLDGAILVPILVTGLLVYGTYYFIAAGFFVQNKTLSLGFLILIASLFNVVLNIVLSKLLGLVGIALGTVIAYVIFLITAYVIGRKIITVTLNFLHILRFIFASIIMSLLIWFIPENGNPILDLTIKVIAGVITYTAINIRFIVKQIKV